MPLTHISPFFLSLIVLTDGQNNYSNGFSHNSSSRSADSDNVKLCALPPWVSLPSRTDDIRLRLLLPYYLFQHRLAYKYGQIVRREELLPGNTPCVGAGWCDIIKAQQKKKYNRNSNYHLQFLTREMRIKTLESE